MNRLAFQHPHSRSTFDNARRDDDENRQNDNEEFIQ